jgi:chondroitin sulfate N-acetylgalactosaminyltransferase 1/2
MSSSSDDQFGQLSDPAYFELSSELLKDSKNTELTNLNGNNEPEQILAAFNMSRQSLMFSKLQQSLVKSEADAYSYSAFTLNRFYPAELGIYKRNIFKPSGVRLDDLTQIVQASVDYLNSKSNQSEKYELVDFLIGFFRTTPVDGSEYELYFRNRSQNSCCLHFKLNRPMSNDLRIVDTNLNLNSNEIANEEAKLLNTDDLIRVSDNQNGKQQANSVTYKKTVHFILPISDGVLMRKNAASLKLFLSMFENVAIGQDRGHFVTLTLVFSYKNSKWKRYLESLLAKFKHRAKFHNMKLISVKNMAFSRARLLQLGVENLKTNQPNENLVFLCDVDVVFNQMFLDLCRFNTVRNRRVFFPILYSFYNPDFASRNITYDPTSVDQLQLSINNRDSGFWRDSGFGMVCVYKEDFEAVGGFGEYSARHKGWGGEDLHLYRRFLRTDLEVFRTTCPYLFHLYHEKSCDRTRLDATQMRDCLNMKVFGEASHKQFGLAFFNQSMSEN